MFTYLQNNELESISLDFMTNLKYLNIEDNKFKELIFPKVDLSRLSLGNSELEKITIKEGKLADLELSGEMANLKEISNGAVIENLTISNTGNASKNAALLGNIRSIIFDGITNTDLTLNEMNTLENVKIKNSKNLKNLILSNDKIFAGIVFENTAIKKNTLNNLPSLTVFNKGYGNGIEELESITLNELGNLTTFGLTYTNLSSVTLNNLPALTELLLSNNKINDISIENSPKITNFDLSYNDIRKLKFLSSLYLLSSLNIKGNMNIDTQTDVENINTMAGLINRGVKITQ